MTQEEMTKIAMKESDPRHFDPYEIMDQGIRDEDELELILAAQGTPIADFLLYVAAMIAAILSWSFLFQAIETGTIFNWMMCPCFAAGAYVLCRLIDWKY